jgi:hypothetical protein
MISDTRTQAEQAPNRQAQMVLPSKDNRDDVPELGYPEYWYPAIPSSLLRRKPRRVKLLGQEVGLFRDRATGRAYALDDWCPHRGVPLTYGRCHFDGTISCVYQAGPSASRTASASQRSPMAPTRHCPRGCVCAPTRPRSARAWSGCSWAKGLPRR